MENSVMKTLRERSKEHVEIKTASSNFNPRIPRQVVEKILDLSLNTLMKYEQEKHIVPIRVKHGGIEIVTYSLEDIDKIRLLRNIKPVKSKNCEVISVFNIKGGTGKSSISKDLAFSYRLMGYSVLIIDADAQSDITGLCDAEPQEVQNPDADCDPSILNLLGWQHPDEGPLYNQVPLESSIKNLAPKFDLIPSDLDLSEVNYSLTKNTWPSLTLKSGHEVPGVVSMFKKFIEDKIEGKYDIVIVDCAPNAEAMNVQILFAATRIFQVLELEAKSLRTLKRNKTFLLRLQELITDGGLEGSGCNWDKVLVLPNKYSKTNIKLQVLAALTELYEAGRDDLFDLSEIVIPQSSIVDKCANAKEPFFSAAIKYGKQNRDTALQAKEFSDYIWGVCHELLDLECDRLLFTQTPTSN